MKKTMLIFLMSLSSLCAWDYRAPGTPPEIGTIILMIPKGYELHEGKRFEFYLTRFTSEKPTEFFADKGYFILTDQELFNLFKGDIPFSFDP